MEYMEHPGFIAFTAKPTPASEMEEDKQKEQDSVQQKNDDKAAE